MLPIVAASLLNFELICVDDEAQVLMSDAIKNEYFEAISGNDEHSKRRRIHMERYILEFCSRNPPRLTDEKFKREGKFSDGNGFDVPIFAFKALQMRVYGAIVEVEGRKSFLAVRLDLSKKQNKADRNKLVAAALDIGALGQRSRQIVAGTGKKK